MRPSTYTGEVASPWTEVKGPSGVRHPSPPSRSYDNRPTSGKKTRTSLRGDTVGQLQEREEERASGEE
jgi:hypothetical protein